MSRRSALIIVVVLAGVIAMFLAARLHYSGKASVKLPAEDCNANLWKHVYRPERLRIIECCTAIEGRIVFLRRESDGDLHIALDPEHKSVLNLVNAIHGGGHLVVEAICEHAPASGDARASCAGFTSQVSVPQIGDRVRVIGAYVTDRENGWNEVHPVTRIEILR